MIRFTYNREIPRSPQTRLLTANAHALGDQYYRTLSASTRAGELDPVWLNLAFSYKGALEELHAHLSTLEDEIEVTLLSEATQKFIALIQIDIEACGKNDSAGSNDRLSDLQS